MKAIHHRNIFWLLMTALAVSSTTMADPVVVGLLTNYHFMPSVDRALKGTYDAYKASFLAVNSSGGILGFPVSLLECQSMYQKALVLNCTRDFLDNSAVFMLGITNVHEHHWIENLAKNESFFFTPEIAGPRWFGRQWAYIRANDFISAAAMLQHVIQELHVRTIGVVWNPDTGNAVEVVPYLQSLCSTLGCEIKAMLPFSSAISNFLAAADRLNYTAFCNASFQALFFYGNVVTGSDQFLRDFMNRSLHGIGGVLPDVSIIAWENSLLSIDTVTRELLAQGYPAERILPRFRIVSGFPHLLDFRYQASRRAFSEISALLGGPEKVMNNTIEYFFTAMLFWLQVQMAISVLERMNGQNMTRYAYIDTLFGVGNFKVDDVMFGPYVGDCIGLEQELGAVCNCNDGSHIAETYQINSTFGIVAVEGGRITTSFSECGNGRSLPKLQAPIIYLAVSSDDSRHIDIAREMLNGSGANSPRNFENVTVGVNSSFKDAISRWRTERYVSVVFPAVMTPEDCLVSTDMVMVDPLHFPARLPSSKFASHVLNLMATLEQEIFAIVADVAREAIPLSLVLRTSEAAQIYEIAVKSLNTFGIEAPSSVSVLGTRDRLQQILTSLRAAAIGGSGGGGGGVAVFVLGVETEEDVHAVVEFLINSPSVVLVYMAFNEFSVHYATITALAANANVSTARRLRFASALPNWSGTDNSNATGSSSLLMRDYTSNTAVRSPLSLRGFIADRAVRSIAARMNPNEEVNTASFLAAWYAAAVIALSPELIFGPYCSSESDSCRVNSGARNIFVRSLSSSMMMTRGNASSSENHNDTFLVVFSSSSPTYHSLASKSSSSSSVSSLTIGLSAGGAFVICMLVIAVAHRSLRSVIETRYAPTDEKKPVTVVFTDIQSSTVLWAEVPEIMGEAIDKHHAILRSELTKHEGYEVKTVGDSFVVAFVSARKAIDFARAAQLSLFRAKWDPLVDIFYARETQTTVEEANSQVTPTPPEHYRTLWNGIRIRIGMHTGICEIKRDSVTNRYDYYGTTVNIAARVESKARGGQVLVSRDTLTSLLDDCDGAQQEEIAVSAGLHELKGIQEAVELFEIPTVPGRTFITGPSVQQPTDETAIGNQRSSDHSFNQQQHSSNDSDTSSANEHRYANGAGGTIAYDHAKNNNTWPVVISKTLALLLSTTPNLRTQQNLLDTLCDYWRLPTSNSTQYSNTAVGVLSVKKMDQRALRKDTRVLQLAERLGPLMELRNGPLA